MNPFALVTVVRREPPSSARVGDAALVTASGEYHGWAGGGLHARGRAARIAARHFRRRAAPAQSFPVRQRRRAASRDAASADGL
jgi:xanthine/CO dehydrogenase XdhC/CoxF family maturation factor